MMAAGHGNDGRFLPGNKVRRRPRTIEELADEVAGEVESGLQRVAAPVLFDLARYREDPVLYAGDRLGVELLPNQAAIAYAYGGLWHLITEEMREWAELENEGHRQIAVTSGQKTGKTRLIIVLALWHFECFVGSRTFVSATIGDQIRTVIWAELFKVLREAIHRPVGACSPNPAAGMLSPDRSREIRGFTGRTIEAIAGYSGNLAYLIDEASHLDKARAEAITGNTAGDGDLGAPILYTSQPTKCEGPFYEAFHERRAYWTRAHFDSEKIAKLQQRRGRHVPGTATPAKMDRWREEYGEDSPFWIVRIRGDFLRNETGRIVSMATIIEAIDRWLDAQADGVLTIGVDPAGPGNAGDEWGFSVVRGLKAIDVHAKRGLSEEQGLAEVEALLTLHRRADELPRVNVDAEGKIGASFYGRLRAIAEERRMKSPATAFAVTGVKTSSKFVRDRTKFELVRDEVSWNLGEWMKVGAIPRDAKLEAELYAPTWTGISMGRIRATHKDQLREFLGRSPDRADALALGVWRPRALLDDEKGADGAAPAPAPEDVYDEAGQFDQQASGDPWWGQGE